MPTCAVSSCLSKDTDEGLRFHRFPSDNKDLGLWLDFCESSTKMDLHNATVCSQHFRKDQYKLVPVLKKGVTPCLKGP